MQIPLYQQNVAATTQIGGAEMSTATPVARAGERLGNTMVQVGAGLEKKRQAKEEERGRAFAKEQEVQAKYRQRMDAEESEAQEVSWYADRKRRRAAFEQVVSQEQDPEVIQEKYEEWAKDEAKVFDDAKLSAEARRSIANNNEGFYADMDIDVSSIYDKARIGEMDRAYIDAQGNALDGAVHQVDGQEMSSEDLFKYATMKRIELGTIDYEDGQKAILGFGDNLALRKVIASSDNNPEEAAKALNESNLSGEKLVVAQDAIRDGRERQERYIGKLQQSTANEVNKSVQAKTMSRNELYDISKETQVIMGKEVPILSESVYSANLSALNASESFDMIKASNQKRLKDINDAIDAVANVGRYDTGTKETDKMYRKIATLGAAGTSRPTMESLLNTANIASERYASDRGWNGESAASMRKITDAYTTLYVGSNYKYKNVDPIMAIVDKTNKFISFTEEHGGRPSQEQIKEWEKSNMGEVYQEKALQRFEDVYRVGERELMKGDKVRVYKGDGVFEEESY